MDADSFAYEKLLAFEVLLIESVPQTGERICGSSYRSEGIDLAKCRVTASIYGPLPAGEIVKVLVPTWPLWGVHLVALIHARRLKDGAAEISR